MADSKDEEPKKKFEDKKEIEEPKKEVEKNRSILGKITNSFKLFLIAGIAGIILGIFMMFGYIPGTWVIGIPILGAGLVILIKSSTHMGFKQAAGVCIVIVGAITWFFDWVRGLLMVIVGIGLIVSEYKDAAQPFIKIIFYIATIFLIWSGLPYLLEISGIELNLYWLLILVPMDTIILFVLWSLSGRDKSRKEILQEKLLEEELGLTKEQSELIKEKVGEKLKRGGEG
jgi:hypothetical protein